RSLYALRDVTGTVEAIPLIASSIMSKKLAEGIDALVLDIKEGSGAFIPERARAEELARTMIAIGRECGREVVALVTAMDRPLGYAVGNALEMEEAVLALRGEGPEDLRRVTLALAAEMLVLGRVETEHAAALRSADAALRDGRALEKMRQIIEAQGGNPCVLDDPAVLPQAPVRRSVEAQISGCVAEIDVRAIGRAAVQLGAGRAVLGAPIDHGVGFHITVKPGEYIQAGARMATVFAADAGTAEAAVQRLRMAIRQGDPRDSLPLVSRRITADGVEELASA
ncbi:MAG: thymidine phosphorylase, partial [Longimicrobiales bacterium]